MQTIKILILLPSTAKAQILSAFSRGRRCHEVTDEVLIKFRSFSRLQTGQPFSLFERENDLTFLCLKEKLQKKQTNVPFDRLCVWERYTESPKTCAASSPTHDSARSRRVLGLRFFGNSHRVEALPDGGRASSGFQRPQALISSPPSADEKPYICALTVINDIKRLALRESSRRSRVRGLSAGPVRPVCRESSDHIRLPCVKGAPP